ncbi:hypothetical protein pb186bvf_005493 [Paramecium bursaria]
MEEITDFTNINPIEAKKELLYFSIAPSIDIQMIQGLEIDLNTKELQMFESDQIKFGVQVFEENIQQQQLMTFFINEKPQQAGLIKKMIKVFQMELIPKIQRKAIRHIKPVIY